MPTVTKNGELVTTFDDVVSRLRGLSPYGTATVIRVNGAFHVYDKPSRKVSDLPPEIRAAIDLVSGYFGGRVLQWSVAMAVGQDRNFPNRVDIVQEVRNGS